MNVVLATSAPGTSSSPRATTPLEGILLERYAGKRTRVSLTKLAKRVESLEYLGPFGSLESLESLESPSPSPSPSSTHQDPLEAIVAKLDLLDSLKFGLGYAVLQRYPVEFLHESAFELWSIMAAVLFTQGLSPESIGSLFKKHPCLFASAVRSPDNVKELFEWMREQGIVEKDALRVINRYPLVLQADVGECLEPRVAYLCEELSLPREQVIPSVVRHPELLSVESGWVQTRIAYYREHLCLDEEDLRALFRAQPSAFAVDVERYLVPMTKILRSYFDLDRSSRHVVKSGLLSRSVDTVLARIRAWTDLGLCDDDLRVALRRFPRLLCYPVTDAKYQEKLGFLRDELGVELSEAVRAFPAIVSYSLDNRIRPRVLAVRKLTGGRKTVTIQQMAMTEAAFLKVHGVDASAYAAFVRDEMRDVTRKAA